MMSSVQDGPRSARFAPLPLRGTTPLSDLANAGISPAMAAAVAAAPSGDCVGWGIPFHVEQVVVIDRQPVTVELSPTTAQWLIFMHTSDRQPASRATHASITPMRGEGRLGEPAATYVLIYADGTEARATIRRRHQIGMFQRRWGENCFEAVAHCKPHPVAPAHEQPGAAWGASQTRVNGNDFAPWINWLWAWENPYPGKPLAALRCEPGEGIVVLSGLAAGTAGAHPLRWQIRRKARLTLPPGITFAPDLDGKGQLTQIQLDMGQVIAATPRLLYPNERWSESYDNQMPQTAAQEMLIEYTAHPDACFHLWDGCTVPVAQLQQAVDGIPLQAVNAAVQRVTLRTVERGSGRPVAVRLHVHGAAGEYLAPVGRHRQPNPSWFEDYGAEFVHVEPPGLAFGGGNPYKEGGILHPCTYVDGEISIDLPLGPVYVEASRGFETRPVRQLLTVTPETRELEVVLDKVLPWRERGWVTADTHVHFLSPATALLEGAAEGVNVVNLLASQWGELVTNAGDFDGRTTWGSREAGGDGEYLVRVGTENRQHVLGHISLLGYEGRMITPLTTGGTDEAALGDPVEVLLSEWARQCKLQDGLVVIPHFPNPRAEHAATLVNGDADAIEMTSWSDFYTGIDPYSLADWYRYLNCGYLVPAVGGTDKMSASMAVGTVRTYAHLQADEPFTYAAWKDAVRRGETFVTYGPLLDFVVSGRPMGSRIALATGGGTLDIAWQVASVTVPVSRVDLVVNGEIRESRRVASGESAGHWQVKIERSAWLALLVRGHYADKPEIIAAHSSPVMVEVASSPLLAAADGVTILEQIEGALAYLDTVGMRAEAAAYTRMRLVLTAAHRTLHNRLHQAGVFHEHAGSGY
jgi:hypothetical protein